MPGTEAPRWRFLITPKWLAWHLIMIGSVYGMLALGDWQLHRAEAGNSLSWAYTFEWPVFAVFAVVFWAKTIRDEFHPPAAAGPGDDDIALPAGAVGAAPRRGAAVAAGEPAAPEEEAELAAYNAYLARLHREVRGHGKWHGLR
ncbi:MAG TPA: hypothetical protein VGY50_06590 [Streptosporangiaceae bacterium]|jgi:hypothetical protein|nr:hypothetical protein [Streptosporangiaceae bacterium]